MTRTQLAAEFSVLLFSTAILAQPHTGNVAMRRAEFSPAATGVGQSCLQIGRDQKRDSATLHRLEQAWNDAFMLGDIQRMKCILTPDFTEIMRDGRILHLTDELNFAAANEGKHLATLPIPNEQVLIHGSVAVAFARVPVKKPQGSGRFMQFADYYIWEKGMWHSFFAQQTLMD